jgi:hypothetical protein
MTGLNLPTKMHGADLSAISATIAAWASAWQQRTPPAIFALWDLADPQSWYLSASSVEPVLGQAVVGVIQRRCLEAKEINYKPGPLHLRQLTPDIGLAFFNLQWSERLARHAHNETQLLGGHVRVTMLMRNINGVWKIFHYAEAPLAPLLELQGYYEAIAADGFDKMPQRDFVLGEQA